MTYSLFRHQAAAETLLTGGSAVLWWEMRTGKTRAALHAANVMINRGELELVLVITKQIAKSVWRKEAEAMGLDLPLAICYGQTKRYLAPNLSALPPNIPRILVLNWEIAHHWLPDLQRMTSSRRFALITDEGHEHLLDPKSKRGKALRDLSMTATRVWELTGTLYTKNAMDIYYQLRLLGKAANPWQFWPAEKFGTEFCEVTANPWAGRILVDPETRKPKTYRSGLIKRSGGYDFKGVRDGGEHEILRRCSSISKIMEEDIRDVPLPVRIPVWIDEGDGFSGYEADIQNATTHLVPRKVELTAQYVQGLPNRQVVVFGWNVEFTRGVYDRLQAGKDRCALISGSQTLLNGRQSTRDEIQEAFSQGRIDVLVGNMKSIGMAIDLASANHAVYGQPYWDAALQFQCEARMRGPKQTRDHLVHHYLLVANSVDEHVWNVKLKKGLAIERFNRAAREIDQEVVA